MTEREIVYSIIETLNANEYNNDNTISERLVRNLIYSYRGEQLRKYYKDGVNLTDECYQTIEIKLDKINPFEFKGVTPQIIEFGNREGFYISKYGISIPVVNNTVYAMASENDLPLAKRIGVNVNLKIQQSLSPCVSGSSKNGIVYNALLSEGRKGSTNVELTAVLVDPSDDSDYNWLTDVFPFPAEKLDELKTTILRKEFGITSQIKSDEVQNVRKDNVRYHENTNLEQ